MEIPVLPVNSVARDGVVFAFRFDDFQRLNNRCSAVTAIKGTRVHRHRNNLAFFDFDNFLLLKIDHRHQVFDRVRPIVTIANVEITHDFQQSLVLLQPVFPIEISHGQRGSHHLARIVYAVFFQRLSIFFAAINN
ncbi:hypothetical protein D3C75_651800 [compost metagenome]